MTQNNMSHYIWFALICSVIAIAYGDFVLYRPEVKPVTWLLWFGPFAVLLGGIGMVWLYMRERQKHTEQTLLSEAQLVRADHVLNPTDHP